MLTFLRISFMLDRDIPRSSSVNTMSLVPILHCAKKPPMYLSRVGVPCRTPLLKTFSALLTKMTSDVVMS